jgi:hypothetical protein
VVRSESGGDVAQEPELLQEFLGQLRLLCGSEIGRSRVTGLLPDGDGDVALAPEVVTYRIDDGGHR